MDGVRIVTGDWETLGGSCRAIRDEVFVVEQKVPIGLEHDANDQVSLHVLATGAAGELIGTGRLLPDGHLGRIAVRRTWRGMGAGGAILALLIEEARERGHNLLVLDAQATALAFYRGFGFREVGERFFAAGLEHQSMELRL